MGAHASHRIHENSLDAYRSSELELSERAQAVFDWIKSNGKATDRQVARGMGFDHKSAVQPRISEMVDDGVLVEVGKAQDPISGKSVRVVDVRREQTQMGLAI